jgi:hypothetical protein
VGQGSAALQAFGGVDRSFGPRPSFHASFNSFFQGRHCGRETMMRIQIISAEINLAQNPLLTKSKQIWKYSGAG